MEIKAGGKIFKRKSSFLALFGRCIGMGSGACLLPYLKFKANALLDPALFFVYSCIIYTEWLSV